MIRVVVSVTNDLVTDQRVDKICNVLCSMGFEVILIGRKKQNSLPISRPYRTIRMKMLFKKGFLFYAEYNIKLFFRLLLTKTDVLLANDLDTLLPNFIVSKLKSKKLVFDSHELFTEIPELNHRQFVKNVWKSIEGFIFPRLKNVYTINQEIATFYKNNYHVQVHVVRNIAPRLKNTGVDIYLEHQIKKNRRMLILQGAGINVDRGAEEAVQMMQFLNNTILYIIGGGDVFESLKQIVKNLKLEDRVFILDKMPYKELMEYTKIADLGLSLDKGTNLNYEYALPNKVFDYIQAQVPLFVSNRKVVADLVRKENIGFVTDTYDPEQMANQLLQVLENNELITTYKTNLIKAAETYCWERESEKVAAIFSNLS